MTVGKILSHLVEYDEILIGNKKRFADYNSISQEVAIEIFRYALQYYLEWDVYMIRDNLTMDIVKKMHLDPLLPKLEFPDELSKNRDLFYVAHLLEPDKIVYTLADKTILTYRSYLNGEIKSTPLNFFCGDIGKRRAAICLRYALSQYNFYSQEEAYAFFASPKATKFLKDKKLLKARDNLFDSSIEFYHESLPKEEKNNALYSFYGFKSVMDLTPEEVQAMSKN